MRVQCDCGVVMKSRHPWRSEFEWIINTCPTHGYQFVRKILHGWESVSHAGMWVVLNRRGSWDHVPKKGGFWFRRHVMWLIRDDEIVEMVKLLKRMEDHYEKRRLSAVETTIAVARRNAKEDKLELVAADFSFQREPVSDEAFFGAARRVSCQAIPVDEPASGYRIYRSSRAGITRELKQYYGSPQMAGAW